MAELVPPISIGVQISDLLDNLALYRDENEPLDQYTDYVIKNQYHKGGNKWMLGIASPTGFQGDTVSFVQLALPTLIWVADWSAARANSPPEIPSPELVGKLASPDFNTNKWILLNKDIETVGIVELEADGRVPTYRISGTYIYGNTQPSEKTLGSPNEGLHRDVRIGLAPYIEANEQTEIVRRIPDSALKIGIIADRNIFRV